MNGQRATGGGEEFCSDDGGNGFAWHDGEVGAGVAEALNLGPALHAGRQV